MLFIDTCDDVDLGLSYQSLWICRNDGQPATKAHVSEQTIKVCGKYKICANYKGFARTIQVCKTTNVWEN